MRGRAAAPLLLIALLLSTSGPALAAVQRFSVHDAEGQRLVVVTYDDDKAIRVGQTQGFLVLVERVNASRNLTVFLEVETYNESAFDVVSLPLLRPLGEEPADLNFRLRAAQDAEPRRYPVYLELTVVNLNATSNQTVVTSALFPMQVTLSPLPTPLGETHTTLSKGEWTALASVGGLLGVAVLAVTVRRHRAAGRRRDER